MAFRIGSHVRGGQLFNLRRNCVHGWLEFGPDEGIRIEVAGNLSGELAGRHFRFEVKSPATVEDCPWAELDKLQMQQVGVIGRAELRRVRDPAAATEAEKTSFYLEWHSQNGTILAEMADVEITFDPQDEEPDPEPLPEAIEGASGIEEIPYGEEADAPEGEEYDPYGLFPPDFDRSLSEPAAPEGPRERPKPRSWDEVIPGIDPETKRMYEEWDEVVHGEKDEPLSTLFDPPLALKPPAQIEGKAEAEEWLRVLLARLALHAMAIDICEHYTPLATYRWLLEEILPGCHIHPRLPQIGFVQHYCTWESCRECEAEFDAKWKQANPEE